jgi:hypothetical protein
LTTALGVGAEVRAGGVYVGAFVGAWVGVGWTAVGFGVGAGFGVGFGAGRGAGFFTGAGSGAGGGGSELVGTVVSWFGVPVAGGATTNATVRPTPSTRAPQKTHRIRDATSPTSLTTPNLALTPREA